MEKFDFMNQRITINEQQNYNWFEKIASQKIIIFIIDVHIIVCI